MRIGDWSLGEGGFLIYRKNPVCTGCDLDLPISFFDLEPQFSCCRGFWTLIKALAFVSIQLLFLHL